MIVNNKEYKALKQSLVANGINNLENSTGQKIPAPNRSHVENRMNKIADSVLSNILKKAGKS